ncbi:DUF892 family protein [Micromonospora olivasterospora]|uniref:Ferritin-like metal-binding protein YciE n=1 Tax=Micromonospora olivasterospora TaxID=1880 RepID=A0A562IE95_MICOL|nr:DUF892 family protein [Micromonospora olivasterospora]TWH69176.1 ferritin-like metal-binding protein YciE [Micromonospora olivasterospora]
MAINTTRDLFIYELGILGEMEISGRRILDFLAHRVSGDLRQIVRRKQQECVQWNHNINSCAKAFGTSLLSTRSDTVEGMYGRFETFVRTNPSADMADQFAVDTLIRFLYLTIAAHKTLFDWAVLMSEGQCVQHLHTNLVQKQESVAEIERYGHELGVRLLAPVARPA